MLDGRADGSRNQPGRAGGCCDGGDGIQPDVRSVLDELRIGVGRDLVRHGLRLTAGVNGSSNSSSCSIHVHGGRADQWLDRGRFRRDKWRTFRVEGIDGNEPSVWNVHGALCCGGGKGWR